jgi:S1-C subfamily serine protease
VQNLNMVVPIDLLTPIFDDLMTLGRRNQPPRPWLGLYATEVEDKVVIVGLASKGPAKRADLRTGDVVLEIAGEEVNDLAGLFRKIWSLGNAGVDIPMKLWRDGDTFDLRVRSSDRNRYLKGPSLH